MGRHPVQHCSALLPRDNVALEVEFADDMPDGDGPVLGDVVAADAYTAEVSDSAGRGGESPPRGRDWGELTLLVRLGDELVLGAGSWNFRIPIALGWTWELAPGPERRRPGF